MAEKNILANSRCINTIKAAIAVLQHNDLMYPNIMSFTCTYYGPQNKLQSLLSNVYCNISKFVYMRKI